MAKTIIHSSHSKLKTRQSHLKTQISSRRPRRTSLTTKLILDWSRRRRTTDCLQRSLPRSDTLYSESTLRDRVSESSTVRFPASDWSHGILRGDTGEPACGRETVHIVGGMEWDKLVSCWGIDKRKTGIFYPSCNLVCVCYNWFGWNRWQILRSIPLLLTSIMFLLLFLKNLVQTKNKD